MSSHTIANDKIPADYIGIRGHICLPRVQSDMRVPDNALRSVGFVSEVVHSDPTTGEELDHFATGFFVSMPSTAVRGMFFMYFVTAKHVARDLQGRDIRLVVNRKGSGIKQVKGIGKVFWGHPSDEAADVAVLPIFAEPDMDTVYVPIKDFVTPEMIRENWRVGIGDEVFIAGLFTYVPGEDRVVPLIRHGNIAMLPEHKIQTDLGFADVYLIESRSIGGISGSPVFVRPTILLSYEQSGEQRRIEPTFGVGGTAFLGVMHGHWDVRESELNNPKLAHSSLHGVNLGIAIVTPAHKLLETLNRSELIVMRELIEQNYKRSITPTTDSGK
jgi:hypothetical protein